ncbi:MAG: Glu/Leu/Phe/Val dehydrogenase dimerization domain-containing protein [Pseudomonadota bacterium]
MELRALQTGVFSHPEFDTHQTIQFVSDAASGLRAIIAVHDTTLGPALGGCRRWRYDTEQDALTDVLRLSAGMTLKNAAAGLDLGGGKAVILSDGLEPSPDMWRAFGQAVDHLGGQYITAEDVGTGQTAVDLISETTTHVRGTSAKGLGDPSPFTAEGVFAGIRAGAKHRFGADNLDGLTVAVQGLGNVGGGVAERAHQDGAQLIVADIDPAKTQDFADKLGATVASVDQIHTVSADIFAPCALGGGLNAETIPEIKALVVAGAANNQLAGDEDAERLRKHGILYAPDFIINAGGVISIALADEFDTADKMNARVARLGDVLAEIFVEADNNERTTQDIAVAHAIERLAKA